MVKVCSNAYGQYIRSRPGAAPESVKRVKEMDKIGQQIGTHPVFGIDLFLFCVWGGGSF